MSILKINCPECAAGLKSTAGFKVGQTVCCKRCETYFVVEEPEEELEEEEPKPAKAPKRAVKAAVVDDEEDEEEEERPRRKKKKRADEEDEGEGSYRNSPLRYIILGILVVVMLVLGFMLYQKKKREREEANAPPPPPVNTNSAAPRPVPADGPNPFVLVNQGQPQGNPGKLPNANPRPPQKGGQGPNAAAVAGGAVGNVFGGGPASFEEAKKLTARYTAALVGRWVADLGDGVTEQLAYTADGTYMATRTGTGPTSASGTYTVQGLVGTKGLKLRLDDSRAITVIFEDDELHHPSLEKGVTAVFRKK